MNMNNDKFRKLHKSNTLNSALSSEYANFFANPLKDA